MVFIVLVLLIVFHIALVLTILTYGFYVALFLAMLGICYLIARLISAISTRLSAASIERAHARQEHARAKQSLLHVEQERVKLAQTVSASPQPVRLAQEATMGVRSRHQRSTRPVEHPPDTQESSAPQAIGRSKRHDAVEGTHTIGLPPLRHFPKAFDLLDVFKRSTIIPGQIFLGMMDEGQSVWIDSVKQLSHSAFNAKSGRGKTVVVRGIEAQLLHVGHQVIHLDPKFALIDDAGLDYRPIARHLMAYDPIEVRPGTFLPHLVTEVQEISDLLLWLKMVELPRRQKHFRAGRHDLNPPLYVFLEEWLYLVDKVPALIAVIKDVIVIGRSLNLKLCGVAQNFQAQSTNLSGGLTENFESAWYLGGDDFSGAKMLDLKQKVMQEYLFHQGIDLGKGIAFFRNNFVVPQPRLLRVGMASNEAVYYLLGRADTFTFASSQITAAHQSPQWRTTKKIVSTTQVVSPAPTPIQHTQAMGAISTPHAHRADQSIENPAPPLDQQFTALLIEDTVLVPEPSNASNVPDAAVFPATAHASRDHFDLLADIRAKKRQK